MPQQNAGLALNLLEQAISKRAQRLADLNDELDVAKDAIRIERHSTIAESPMSPSSRSLTDSDTRHGVETLSASVQAKVKSFASSNKLERYTHIAPAETIMQIAVHLM